MVIIVMKDRCCFETDLEAIRICHKWNTKFIIVRTKFDVDVRAFVHDRPEKLRELREDGKFNKQEIARCVRMEMVEEFTQSLSKQGIVRAFKFDKIRFEDSSRPMWRSMRSSFTL